MRRVVTLLVLVVVVAAVALLAVFRRFSSDRAASLTANPSAQAAAKRALCLASLVLRAKTEYQLHPEPGDLPGTNEPVDPGFADTQNAWLKKEMLWQAASNQERGLFEKKLGTWTKKEIAHAQWRWLWRARTTQLQREHSEPPKGMTYESIIAETAKKAQEDGLFTAIDGDFPALHRAYAKLSEREWETMRSIATERLYALNWLCRDAEDWDEVSTDT